MSIRRSFSLAPSTYGKFIPVIYTSWISVDCICCYDCDKLWLFVILLKILLMFSWYLLSFSTCFILPFSLAKRSLLVIMKYSLLNKEGITLFLQLVWWVELLCRHRSVCVDFRYSSTKIFQLFRFNKVSTKATSPLLFFFIVKLMFWWKLMMWWKKISKCVSLRMVWMPITNRS